MSSQNQNRSLEQAGPSGSGGQVGVRVVNWSGSDRLCISPKRDHKPENYDDLQFEFNPNIFASLEHYLPPHMLNLSRDVKLHYIRNILLRYLPENDRIWIQKLREYRLKIILNYPPLHKEIFTMDAESFFVPSFLRAIKENTEASFRSIMAEPCKGVYTFEMLQPQFCKKLMSEVDHFERWVHGTKLRIMRPNAMNKNKHGVILDDFAFEAMLDRFMCDFIQPISRVFYPELGGSSLDSHHGFVVEYGINKDVELGDAGSSITIKVSGSQNRSRPGSNSNINQSGQNKGNSSVAFSGLHEDEAEVTLNVCLGKEFSGGDLFFQGVRCDAHVTTNTQPEEAFNYSHVPGHAILHPGRNRHGTRPTTSGNRMNLILWCRSSAFIELKRYQRDFYSWCAECRRKKAERVRLSVVAAKQELLKSEI
ncbi:putative PKHD-type hydroxylase [Glycine soja]|uniref:Putative PKHD-type hydroxylase n=1 Tax=Glycine soja TaxID=3848 RepID=A0A445F440_GLYSO|nr:putative PKHD-type hydroxylase [Glycine soja]